ncbi:DNA repair protein xrcc3 [Arachnomyces sp. PD_36]|nr:DNA repair protein xrcc3 [Arachnomyces sp. PD_36]
MDLLSILPDFPIGTYEHILPSLERNYITTTDLLTLDTIEIAKRTRVPLTDARQFTEHVIRALHEDVGFGQEQQEQRHSVEDTREPGITSAISPGEPTSFGKIDVSEWNCISTLDSALDDVLGGGIPTGYVTEITGESGTGKSQFLLHLLLSVQLPPPVGLSRRALYISTESPLPTNRLNQLLETHPAFVTIPSDITPPSLENVISLNAIDLETQEHIINYQLPIAVSSYDVGLVVIDSVTWNYRGEYTLDSDGMASRAGKLVNLGRILRDLAVKEGLAVVVANQVLDRFDDVSDGFHVDQFIHLPPNEKSQSASSLVPDDTETVPNRSQTSRVCSQSVNPSTPQFPNEPQSSAPSATPVTTSPSPNLLSLSHQQRFFTGWGDRPPDGALRTEDISGGLKTPALGLLWSSQIACRIVLKKHSPLIPTTPVVDATGISSQPNTQSSQPPSGCKPVSSAGGNDMKTYSQLTSSTSLVPTARGTPNMNRAILDTSDGRISDCQYECPGHEPSSGTTVRTMKLVFAPWTSGRPKRGSSQEAGEDPEMDREVEFRIWEGGIRTLEL